MGLVYLCSKREASIKQNIPWDKIDARIRGLVWRFNQVPGMATTQSCAGHVKSKGDEVFQVQEATIALFVNRKRLFQLLTLVPQCGLTDLNIKYFTDGTFWACFSWEPESYEPAYKMTRILLGEEQPND